MDITYAHEQRTLRMDNMEALEWNHFTTVYLEENERPRAPTVVYSGLKLVDQVKTRIYP